jgi:hypothetical protein
LESAAGGALTIIVRIPIEYGTIAEEYPGANGVFDV